MELIPHGSASLNPTMLAVVGLAWDVIRVFIVVGRTLQHTDSYDRRPDCRTRFGSSVLAHSPATSAVP